MRRGRIHDTDATRIALLVDRRFRANWDKMHNRVVSSAAQMGALGGAQTATGASPQQFVPCAFQSDGDGTNNSGITRTSSTVWVLTYVPVAASLVVFRNGRAMREGAGYAYTLTSKTITLTGGDWTIENDDHIFGQYTTAAGE